jgi:hypothetical protein
VIHVFMARSSDRVENADSRQECHGLAGGREQLFNGFLMIAGLSEYLVIEHRELIGTDDERLAGTDGYGFGFFPRQMTREILRPKSLFVAFINFGGDRFILIEKSIEQAPPV